MSVHTPTSGGGEGLSALMGEMPCYGAEFAGTYANHAPMVVVALARLGASPERARAFFAHYRDANRLLPPPGPVAPLTRADWRTALGERGRMSDLVAFFESEVGARGGERALATYLPELSPGVGASALHALMRTAYAAMRQDEGEIAQALGYWAATFLDMPRATGAPPVTDDPAEVLAMVGRIAALRRLPIHELLWHNVRASGREPAFAPVVDWLAIGGDTVPRMAGASIALFAATQDFCALHAVTGTHWVRLVAPYTPQPERLIRHFWQVIAALMPQMRFPALPDGGTLERWRSLPASSWEEIAAAAIRSDDEHDISLAFSAREEFALYGDPLYRLATARRLGLVADYRAAGMAPAHA